GTWMSIIEGFGGMRIKDGKLCFSPKIPEQWDMYSFKINFRNRIIKVTVTQNGTTFNIDEGDSLEVLVNDTPISISH
ncbi:MAG: glycosyl hydrolase family 65 protein, partial [Bacteroidota bacterium]|nr:glycosyl hydrolase family 65 protein [Bacteroidota bacterium]